MMDENFDQDACFSMSSEKIRNSTGMEAQVEFKEGVKKYRTGLTEWDIIKRTSHDYIHKI